MATITQGGTGIDIGAWLNTMYGDYAGTQAQYQTAFGQGISTLQGAADLYAPGGAYGAGAEAAISRAGEKYVASGYQNLVSSGLANTTIPGSLEATFQEEIGVPALLQSQDQQMQLYGGALSNLASAYGGYNPPGATTGGNIAMMATGGFSGLTSEFASMLDYVAATQQDQGSSMFWGDDSSGGDGTGGGGGGGGTSGGFGGTSGGFPNPYGGGSSGSGGYPGEGGVPEVWAGGQQYVPGTNIQWGKNVSRNAADQQGITSNLLNAGYTYDSNSGTYVAPSGGGAADESLTQNVVPGGTGPSVFNPGGSSNTNPFWNIYGDPNLSY